MAAVARGLAALGHEVHVLVTPGPGSVPRDPGVHWYPFSPPLGIRQLRFLRSSAVRAISARIRPDVDDGALLQLRRRGTARGGGAGIPYVLEVNAPIVDYAKSPKQKLDRALLVEPMRRWRDRLCAAAALIVTPSAAIVPSVVRASRYSKSSGAPTRSAFGLARGARCRSRDGPARSSRCLPARSGPGMVQSISSRRCANSRAAVAWTWLRC